ncbi:MAG: dihydrolipoyl dehydrogenase [Myxococcales bacterium]|nr:dihydrolipoyl dehydrogenase [Myxococcales bacterium]
MVVGSMARGCEHVVIGAGPGGYLAALRLAQQGRDVLLVDTRGALGGVCLNEGCIPSKALIHAANLASEARHAAAMGIEIGDVRVDLPKLVSWKDSVVKRLTGGVRTLTDKAGVAHMVGRARFVSDSELDVEGESATQRVTFDSAIVATGTRPIELADLPFDGERVIGSREALSPSSLPERLAVVGAGYIGLELGLVYAKLGVQVEIVDVVPALLPDLDPMVGKLMTRVLRDLGVNLHLESRAVGYHGEALALQRLGAADDDARQLVPCDRVLVCVGRRPLTDNLGLDVAGVELDPSGHIKVDEQQRTSAENIYAIGDVVDGPPLAHKAYREAEVAAASIVAPGSAAFDNQVIPAVIYTDPEIAWVGLDERTARARGYEVLTGRFPLRVSGRAMTLGAEQGFIKAVANAADERLLGVTIVAPNASELIGEATLAIEMGAFLDDVADTIHAHPTLSEGLQEAMHLCLGKGVHVAS